MNYEQIKHNYDRGLWTAAMVQMTVRKGVLTQDEANSIINGTDRPSDADAVMDIIQGVI